MNRKKLSIAMCTYNGALYLQEQLDSFKSQTRVPDELVVCDDRSSDGTNKIIKAFAREVPFAVRLFVNESNLGSTNNFEKAIGLCEGDIIFLSDQDDVWLPEKLARVEEVFSRSPNADGVLTDAVIVDAYLKPLGFNFWQATKFNRKQQEKAMARRPEILIKYSSSMAGATFAFCSRLRDMVLPVPTYWTHDAWIALIIALVAKLEIIPEPLNLWRQHEHQQLGSWNKKSLSEMKDLAFNKDLSHDADIAERLYESAKERIDAMNVSDYRISENLSMLLMRLKEKSSHLNARSDMAKSRILRLPAIVDELSSGRYFRYSSGLKSVARDFIY